MLELLGFKERGQNSVKDFFTNGCSKNCFYKTWSQKGKVKDDNKERGMEVWLFHTLKYL